MAYKTLGINFPTLQQLADSIDKRRPNETPPTHSVDTIFFHNFSYTKDEFKKHILNKTNIGRLFVAEYYGSLVRLAEESESF